MQYKNSPPNLVAFKSLPFYLSLQFGELMGGYYDSCGITWDCSLLEAPLGEGVTGPVAGAARGPVEPSTSASLLHSLLCGLGFIQHGTWVPRVKKLLGLLKAEAWNWHGVASATLFWLKPIIGIA